MRRKPPELRSTVTPGSLNRAPPPRGARSALRQSAEPPGQKLDESTRARMEARFNHDFSQVRVHADAQAARSADAVGARAYTIGSDVVFGAAEYQPHSERGTRLIAHELTHVVQQRRGGHSPDAEQRADRAAARIAQGAAVSPGELGGAPRSLQAQPKPETQPETKPATGPETRAGEETKPAAGPQETISGILDNFALDSDVVTEDHKKEIDQLAFSISLRTGGLLGKGRATIAIAGHTDTSGPDAHNQGLSERRAANVKAALQEALTKQKVESASITAITTAGFGEKKLRVETKDNVKEPKNRRVEITVTIETPPPPKPPISLDLPPGYIPPATVPPPSPGIPNVPTPSREWLKNYLENDAILKQLPKSYRERAVDALKDLDEIAAGKIIDAVPLDGKTKEAMKAAVKALLETLKGRKFTPPTPPPKPPDFGPEHPFPKLPGEVIIPSPQIPLPKPFD